MRSFNVSPIRSFSFIYAACTVFSFSANAQQDCSNVLITDTYNKSSWISEDYRLSEFVSESEWNSLNTKVGANGMIYGVPVGASFNEYKASSNSKLQNKNVRISKAQAENILWTGLGANSLEAYRACIRNNSAGGLNVFARGATERQVELVIEYRAATDSKPLSLEWEGAPAELRDVLPKDIKANQEYVKILKRPESDEFLLGLNDVNGTVKPPPAITITAWRKPPNPPCVQLNSDGKCIRCEFDLAISGLKTEGRIERVCPNMPSDAMVATAFNGTIAVNRLAPGSSCWAVSNVLMGGGTVVKEMVSSVAVSCEFSANGETGFAKLNPDVTRDAGLSAICQWGGQGSTCNVTGTLKIFTADGQ